MPGLNKKELSERDICTKFITPALVKAGWDVQTQIREEVGLTKGRVIVSGRVHRRGETKRADYLLHYKPNLPLVIGEAKDNNHAVGAGMQQGLGYADILKDVPFVFSSNGDGFLFHDRTVKSGPVEKELTLDEFPSPEELWRRYCAIPQLRQAILQLAVQGRLVPQQRTRNGIENVRFESIIQDSRYGTAKKCDYRTSGTPVLRIPNVVGGKIDLSDLKRTELTAVERRNYGLEAGDILMVRSNGSLSLVGRAAVVSSESVGHAFAGYLVRVRLKPDIAFPAYVALALSCADVRNQIEVPIRTTSGVKNINTQEIYRLSFPLPPLAEQKRIVARVEELLRWCDTLEAQLHQTRTLGAHLLASTLHHLLAA